ncbi:MAG: lamin tail domain-containing protein [Bacteroidia bacterium]|jgi:hypothetical protein|nr:lamin tail domain-containing protein [Bacteroidia bacterium]
MKPLFVTLALLCLSRLVSAQLYESFTDLNHTTNPEWFGDDSLFIVNTNLQLQSKASISKTISLTTAIPTDANEWRFWCRFRFSPSTSNFMRVYLASDTNNVTGAVTGYYVQLGGVSGSSDSITLYKQEGTTHKRLIGGRPSTVSKSDNIVRIKVVYNKTNEWQLYADTSGGFQYVLEGEASDMQKETGAHMGVFAKLTSSNGSGFYWDEFYAVPIQLDTVSPQLESIEVLSNTQLRLVFNEPILLTSAMATDNYWVNEQVGEPQQVQLRGAKQNEILLSYLTPIANGRHTIVVQGVCDIAGNPMKNEQKPFLVSLYQANRGDVLISEIFPDPTPVVDLPEAEFVELYNRSDKPIQLKGWRISDGNTVGVLPEVLLLPDSFLLLCGLSSVVLFNRNVVGISPWPSLNNGEDIITITDSLGKLIDELHYDITWYNNAQKADGGFTIEMDNPLLLCKGKSNYAASDAAIGGTPGSKNSRWNKMPDVLSPQVKSIRVLNANQLELVFNESMDSLSLLLAKLDLVPPNNIRAKETIGSDTLIVTLAFEMLPNQLNTLHICEAKDCSLNPIDSVLGYNFTRLVFDTAQQFDILITEIMSDPDPAVGLPAIEYVELYNKSNRWITLNNWLLECNNKKAAMPNIYLKPETYLLVALSNEESAYDTLANFCKLPTLSALSNDGAKLVLRDDRGQVIHAIEYASDWHTKEEKKAGGWSLEMIDSKNPCSGKSNWESSISENGGTPGIANSVARTHSDEIAPNLVRVYPIDSMHLELHFSEPMDSTSIQEGVIVFTPNNISVSSVQFEDPMHTNCVLGLNKPIKIPEKYWVTVNQGHDCVKNRIAPMRIEFGLPEVADSGDWVVNEILFNPRPGENDFVELLNRSSKVLDAKELWISNAQVTTNMQVAPQGWLVLPQQYLVVTADAASLVTHYTVQNPQCIVEQTLPTFNDDEGTCIVRNNQQKILDQLDYTHKMQFALLANEEGVSLERIHPNRPTFDITNWTSAASTAGYATPTASNSQFADASVAGIFTVTPELISPDGDGYNDFATFGYQLQTPGYTANLNIYNSSGQLVKQLLRNQLFGADGAFSWDGLTDNGNKAPMGLYVCVLELFNLQGQSKQYKQVLAVGGRL